MPCDISITDVHQLKSRSKPGASPHPSHQQEHLGHVGFCAQVSQELAAGYKLTAALLCDIRQGPSHAGPPFPQLYIEGLNQHGSVPQILVNQDPQSMLINHPSGNTYQTMVPEPPSQTQMQAPCEKAPGLTCLSCPWGPPQFLYSPTLLEVLPREAALTMLEQSLGDPSPDVHMLSLQGLGNIIFHPEKVRPAGHHS